MIIEGMAPSNIYLGATSQAEKTRIRKQGHSSPIENGALDPEAIVVRPFCMCDGDYGYVEVRHLDQVVRRYERVPVSAELDEERGEPIASRIFMYGNVEPGPFTEKTLKLG